MRSSAIRGSCETVAKRPPHSKHEGCLHASWAACDAAAKVQWGQCKAVVGDREPVPCTRWAVSDSGWCWQHYASETERLKREADAIAIRKSQQDRIDAYLQWVAEHPSVHDGRPLSRPTAPPPFKDTVGKVVGTPPPTRKGPRKLSEQELAELLA